MRTIRALRGRTAWGAVAVLGLLIATGAWAQTTSGGGTATGSAPSGQSSAGMNGKIMGAGSGSSGGAAGGDIVDPSNGGVAGTGLGKTTGNGSTGTGGSVKGPAGQGISNSTDTGKTTP